MFSVDIVDEGTIYIGTCQSRVLRVSERLLCKSNAVVKLAVTLIFFGQMLWKNSLPVH